MLKNRLLLLFLCAGLASQAQKTDSLRRTDSLIETIKENVLDNIPTISLDDNDLGDKGTQDVSSILTAGRDPFFSAASYNFSASHFKIRGYDNDHFSTYMNGVPMESLDNGFTPYGLWGGLNDVMHSRDVNYGLHPTTFSFGEIGGTTNIDVRASKQRAQTSFTYANANRNYRHRWTYTQSTGMSKKGWAFSFSGSRRWAEEGYVPGTYYDGWSYFVGIDKRINQKHLLSLVAFGAPTENGRQGAATQEMIDLAGDPYYNSNWGYQNGKKRNASIARSNQPVIILSHEFRIKNNMSLMSGVSYSFGDRSVSGLDWYNAPDPHPDYYRYLPSYTSKYASVPDSVQGAQVADLMRNDINLRQINWQRLYDVNRSDYSTVNNANGIAGNNVTGLRSRYIIENRVVNTERVNLNSTFNARITNSLDLSAGVSYQRQNNHYYKKVEDLLGGEFYVDLNQFAERDFPANDSANQNNLNNPNRILKVGDKFGYDYNINLNQAQTWAQGSFKFSKVDFFVAGQFSHTEFKRIGHTRPGLFKDISYGPSQNNLFDNYSAKAGVTYKIDGRNYLYVNGAYETKAPYFENVYISPRTRNTEQSNLTSENIQSIEGGYQMNAPKIKVHLSGYYTHFANQMDVMTFYNDLYQNFVNYALSGISKLHYGGEFGTEVKVAPNWTVNAAAAVGRYYYDGNQYASITVDNSSLPLVDTPQTIYMKNFRVPSTPQQVYSLGATYRSPKYWFVSLTANYFDEYYLSTNPLRRTYDALKTESYNSPNYHTIFDQTKLDGQYSLDLFAGYSWRLPRAFNLNKKPTYLVFNLSVSNLTNNRKIISGGYEQLRFEANPGPNNTVDLNKFPPKVYYAYGVNYYASMTIRF